MEFSFQVNGRGLASQHVRHCVYRLCCICAMLQYKVLRKFKKYGQVILRDC